MDAHGESSREKAAGGYQRKGSPRKVSSGGKIVKKGRPGPGDHEKRVGRWGKAFSPHRSRLRKTKARQLRIRLGRERSTLFSARAAGTIREQIVTQRGEVLADPERTG